MSDQIPVGDDPAAMLINTDFFQSLTPEEQERQLALIREQNQPDILGGAFNDSSPPSLDQILEPYRDGTQYQMLMGMNTNQRLIIQGRLKAAGFTPANYVPTGMVDDVAVRAMSDVLTTANRTGITYTAVLRQQEQMIEQGLQGQGLAGLGSTTGRVYQKPNTAALQTVVESTFTDNLGRPPTQAEMRQFTDQLMSGYQQSVEQQMAAANYEGRADIVQEQVDPRAEFQRTFQQRYAGTMARNEQQESTTVAQNVAIGQAANVERAAGL